MCFFVKNGTFCCIYGILYVVVNQDSFDYMLFLSECEVFV